MLLFAYTGFSQIKNNLDVRYENQLKGDLTFIANNIVNRDNSGGDPEDPYNVTGSSSSYNDDLNMQYIDIDGDPSTFSSSSATLAVPDPSCSRIRYAGLYWSAVYLDSNRSSDFNQVKFRVPGGSYLDLTADEILFDGDGDSDFGNYAPYACYKDVTDIVTALGNPDGEYFVGNVRASSGDAVQGGVSGGWTMVVVYENPTYPGKYITTFDGYAGIKAGETVDIPIDGFTTLPAPFPVRAKLGVATLEGDNRITGDQLSIKADSNGGFTTLSNSANPSTNFFNSNITNEGTIVTSRNPNSINTLGWDVDLFTIPNPSNSVIPNDETGATLRASSTGDKYDIFFTSLDVEIIEPKINLGKTVEDIAGNDITGQGVHLGQYLDYVLTFENVGNDDAVGYTIRDVLPINVTLDESSISMPTDVTYTYDPATRTIIFSIPDRYVEEYDPAAIIRMRVQVAENCFDFIDACTDIIENLAYSTYSGAINQAPITDDPSVYDFDGCGFPYPGATNFLLDDLEACDFTRTVQLCGDNVLLDAGDNFDNYIWYRDENGNGQIDVGIDTVITDSDSDSDPSTMLVNAIGTYIVDKQVADPCKDFQEIINVELFGSVQSNPITALINDTSNTIDGSIDICPNDGSELPEIFLCGLNDSELLQINIPDATSIVWEQLDEASCSASVDGCANTNTGCTWNTVDTGNDFLAQNTGQYRLVINYQNGCFSRFYFNIYKNPLNPQYISEDIICTNPGSIEVINMPDTYEFQLVDQTTGNVLVPYGPDKTFEITNNGAYMVEMRQQGVTDGCVFVLDNIGILDRDFQVDIVSQDVYNCTGLGEIAISVLNVEAQYYYEISSGGTSVDSFGPTNDNNHTFENLNDGTYDVTVTTDDGCSYTEQIIIQDLLDLDLEARVSQHITCKEGNIQMSSTGGKTPHLYAIWSFVDRNGITQISYPSVADIPPSEFQPEQIFDVVGAAGAGTYTYVVIDRFNCHAFSNPVEIEFRPAAEYNATSVMDVLCYGESTGTITFNLVDDNGYQLTYYLFDATGFDEDNYDFANALATNTSGNFPGLGSGDYVVVINQRKGSASCDYYEYHSISAPTNALDAEVEIVQNYTCSQPGEVRIFNVQGGSAPYEYSVDGVNFVADSGTLLEESFTNLTDGTYTLTVRDANGCTFSDSVTIPPSDPPSDLSFTATIPGCPDQTSDVTVTVTEGTAAFTFEIIAPIALPADSVSGDTATFNDLDPDSYTFRVTDANGCQYTETYTILPTTPISVVGQATANISCVNAADGEALFTVSGFNTSYDYSITGPSAYTNTGTAETNATISLTNLEDGTYTITVTDTDTNCIATTTVTIAAPPAPLTLTVTPTPPTCDTDGSVTLTASGGWGGYDYSITYPVSGTTFTNTTGIFNNLDESGTYNVSVTDTNGCLVTDSFLMNNITPPTASVDATTDLCYDSSTGATVVVGVSGGTAPYSYSINGGPLRSSNTFNNLVPGTYTFTVVDVNGCSDDIDTPIIVQPQLTASLSLDKDLDCTINPDAELGLTVNGGYPPYTYEVNIDGTGYTSYAGGFPYTTSSDGTYQFRVTDSEGCVVETNTLTVNPLSPPQATATITEPVCSGDINGMVQIVVDTNFGAAPYQISFNGSAFTSQTTYTGLAPGNYSYTVRDSKNCTYTDTVTLTDPDPFTANVTPIDVSCDPSGGDIPGRIEVEIPLSSGGVPNFTYTLYDSQNNIVPTTGPNPVVNTSSRNVVFDGLDFGDYYVRVIDAKGCEYYENPVRILASPFLTLENTVFSDCIVGGTIEVTADSGSGNYSFEIYGPGTLPDSTTPGAGSEVTAVFNGLDAGQTYVIRALDTDTNCSSFVVVDVPPLSNIDVVADPTITDVSCNGDTDGSIAFQFENYDASVTNINYEIRESLTNTPLGGAYSGTVTGPVGPGPTPEVTINNLSPGDYVLYFQEATTPSCSNTYNFSIREPNPVTLNLVSQNNGTCNDNANVTVLAGGGSGSFTYAFVQDGTTPVSSDYTTSNYAELDPSVNTEWDVYVLDSNDCTTTPLDITIADDPAPVISLTSNQCVGDEGTFNITVTLDNTGVGPYTVSLNGGAYVSTSMANVGDTHQFTNLPSGNYTVTLRDVNGCADTQTITIEPPISLTALPTVMPSCTNGDGQVTLTASGGSGSYEYELFYASGPSTGTSVTGSAQPSNIFNGLDAGLYDAVVYDTTLSGCSATTSVELELPTPVSFTLSSTNVTCAGDSDGTIRVTLGPGSDNPIYEYELIAVSGNAISRPLQTDSLFQNLPSGVYDVRVVSGRGCELVNQVTITEPAPLDATVTDITQLTCDANNGTQQAEIEVTIATGTGTPTYFYSVNGGAFTATGGNVFTYTTTLDGTYDIVIRDSNGCTFPLPTQTIDPLPQMSLSIANVVDITCSNLGEDITVIASGQSTPDDLTFEVLETGDTQTVATDRATFTLPSPGDYTIQVTDNGTGCYEYITHLVEPYDTIDVVATATSPAMCFDSAGELTITVSNYNGPFDYSVFRADGTLIVSASENTATGPFPVTHPDLIGGNYYVEVTATGTPFCDATSGTVTIVSPSAELDFTPQEVANVTCTNDLGEILVAPVGGYAPYDIVLTNTTTTQVYPTIYDVQSHVFTGLSAGDYTIRVTDAGGCFEDRTLTLLPPAPIVADINVSSTSLDCYGDDTASVWADPVTGGSGSYDYQLNYYDETGTTIIFTTGPQRSNIFNNLGAGTYSITVTDNWSCSDTTDTVTISEPTEVRASLIKLEDLTCFTNGSMRLSATGGTAPYQYFDENTSTWENFDNPTSHHDFLNMGAGQYQYMVRDVNGCTAMISNQVSLREPPELILEIDDRAAFINCAGEATATIIARATGGLGNYSYELFSDPGFSNLVDGPNTTGRFDDLMAGEYYVRVTSEDCIEESPMIPILDPAPLQVERQEFTDITCAGMEDGTISVEVSGGTGEILYAISPSLNRFDTVNTFTDLAPGIYDVIAQDVNGCFITFRFELEQPEPIVAEAINITDEVCFESGDGSFEIQISGGTAPYETSLNSSADANFVQDQTLFQNLTAGAHVVFIRDAQGCETNVIVEIDPGVVLAATVTPMYECTGNTPNNYLNIVLEDESIAGDLMYALDSTDPADMQLSADFTNMTPGDHYLTIAHANGCMATYDFTIATFEPLVLTLENRTINQITAIADGGVEDYTFYFNDVDNGTDNTYFISSTGTYTVTVVDQNGCEATAEIFMEFIDIEFPNFFTPDGDGRNDFWIPDNIEGFPDVLIKIYDRYGRVVEEMTRNVKGWDGNYEGKPLPTGDYWYVVRLEGAQDNREFVGHFTLYRE